MAIFDDPNFWVSWEAISPTASPGYAYDISSVWQERKWKPWFVGENKNENEQNINFIAETGYENCDECDFHENENGIISNDNGFFNTRTTFMVL